MSMFNVTESGYAADDIRRWLRRTHTHTFQIDLTRPPYHMNVLPLWLRHTIGCRYSDTSLICLFIVLSIFTYFQFESICWHSRRTISPFPSRSHNHKVNSIDKIRIIRENERAQAIAAGNRRRTVKRQEYYRTVNGEYECWAWKLVAAGSKLLTFWSDTDSFHLNPWFSFERFAQHWNWNYSLCRSSRVQRWRDMLQWE